MILQKPENILTDAFGRKHDYLRISLTERCNLRCFYCMPAEGIPLRPKDHFMRTEEIISIAKTFVELGVKKIRLTGGEPLIRKDADSIIKQLSELPIELGITTNGILVDQFIDCFEACGLKAINVSLDSLQNEKMASITRRDYFDRIMSNIQLLIDRGFDVKINTVVMRGTNDDEIVDFIEWTRNTNVHVRFIEFMPFGGNDWDWSKGVSLDEILSRTTDRFGAFGFERITDRANDTSKNYRLKGGIGTFAVISSVTNPFCDTCNRIRLTADGKLKNCLFSNSETDLLTSLRAGNNILELIQDNILNKRSMRGGMDSISDFSNPALNQQNRSMVAIGG
ncbi:MAG: GTP 3',8-cyclase MoaA [Flavobacteriales bacterium]|nr:GTP 3',8-cyclase MoaA [Flavobacteriales bacterium]